ncbi:MAG: type II CRISPR RNA-guided endonuclease Cas9 [Eubacteriales bacterium]
MKKEFDEYYLGLDIGTESVGWAATTENYELLSLNRKDLWGAHLFEEAQSAVERRTQRSARRRRAREVARLVLLRSFFFEEIEKLDSSFYIRLKDSSFCEEDKEGKYALFQDDTYTDVEYHKEFPTIYHLRQELLTSKSSKDPRLVYLAIHHILKHRGHFIFEGQDFSEVTDFTNSFTHLVDLWEEFGIQFDCADEKSIEALLKKENATKTDKKNGLFPLLFGNIKIKGHKQEESITNLLSGGNCNLADLFDDPSLAESDYSKISFSDGIDDKLDGLTDLLEEKTPLLLSIKAVYDWSVLVKILGDSSYLSTAKVKSYEEHGKDLATLKAMLNKYADVSLKKKILKDEKVENNYVSFLGRGKKICTQGDFNKFLLKHCKEFPLETEEETTFLKKLEERSAIPRQVTKDNGVIPYQIHLLELKKILENAENYLPFLQEKDESGLSISEKIISIFTFRIPYFVGPLNKNGSENAWIVKKESAPVGEKITPWNFNQIVDLEQSADAFITRMTNQCTYLVGEQCSVLPKESILYSKYNILNQLNNLRVEGELLSVEVKQKLFHHFYMERSSTKKLSFKQLTTYFKNAGIYPDCQEKSFSGVDGEILGSFQAYHKFKTIFSGDLPSMEILEAIIRDIVILGESKHLLENRLTIQYGFSPEVVSKIKRLSFTGWGNFSRQFLTEIYHTDPSTGECFTILEALYETDSNLMQLLSSNYNFKEQIDLWNEEHGTHIQKLSAEILKDLYVSPAIRRSIWRTLMITQEVVKITGHPPTKIFVETARDFSGDKKGKRTVSRKNQLLEWYKEAKMVNDDLYYSLMAEEESALQDRRLYLYYAQLGRCMYSNTPINLRELESGYDLDHIYPQSKVKDDSLQNNMVLVKRTTNAIKDNTYPIPEECLGKGSSDFWRQLKEKKFITTEKYNRLTRRSDFSLDELSGFINRQLVETRQSSKAVASILQKLYPDTTVVYVKAANVTTFRKKIKFLKSRKVNMFHHAHDAYLNIVVGNVYHEKFTSNPLHYLKKNPKYTVNPERIFDYTLERGGKVIWNTNDGTSIAKVKKQLQKNSVLYTRYAFTSQGGFYDQNPVIKNHGQLPIKTSDPRFSLLTEEGGFKYGGYNSVKGAYFCFVEHTVKKKKVRSIEYVSILENSCISSKEDLLQYCKTFLKLEEPRILISKIKINSLFKVDGFLMHLSGRSSGGKQLSFKGAIPLIVHPKDYEYIRQVEKYHEKNMERSRANQGPSPLSSLSLLKAEENLRIYDIISYKLKSTLYSRMLSAQIPKFEQGREKFDELTLPEQCQFIYQAVALFGTASSGKDLTLIGGGKNDGKILISKNISEKSKVSLINQSVTGIFSQEIDLNDPNLSL